MIEFERTWKKLTQTSSRHKKSLTSISWLWLGTIAGAGLTFLTQVILARTLGVEQFGAFSSALATVTLLAPLAGFGVSAYWLNVFGREGIEAQRWLPGSFRFITFSTTCVLLALLLWAWAGPHDKDTSWTLTILATHIFGLVAIELTNSKYQLEGRHARLASWQFSPHALRFTIILLLTATISKDSLDPKYIAIAFSLTATIIASLGIYQLRSMTKNTFIIEGKTNHQHTQPEIKSETPSALEVISNAWPFGLSGIFYIIYFQSVVILIKYLENESSAGLYNAAFVIIGATFLIPGIFYQKFLLPKLHRWAHHDQEKLQRAHKLGSLLMVILGLSVMLTLWVATPPIFPMIFGIQYQGAITPLMILAVAAPFRYASSSAGAILSTKKIMAKIKIMGVAAIFNITINYFLISRYGVNGAAISTVLTEALLFLMFTKAIKFAPGK